jgi:hypothetical protein
MKTTDPTQPAESPAPGSHPWLMAGLCFVLGIVLTGAWLHHQHAASVRNSAGLSAITQSQLAQLGAPVAVRYYSLLPGSPDEALQAYAGRVAQLLDAIQSASDGKVRVTGFDVPAETNAAAATTDGIQPFDLNKGGASFLGLIMTSGTNREVFARLQPEWEPALEFDLVRALVRVATVPPPPKPAPEIARPDPEIIASIHRLIPDVNATTVATADQIFHAEFMRECEAAGTETETKMNAAQQRVMQAQAGGSAAELEAARKNLAQVQVAQAEEIRQIAARLQIRLAVFQNLKNAAGQNSN